MWKKQGLGVRGTNIMFYSKRLGDPENTELYVQANNDCVEAITIYYDCSQSNDRYEDAYIFLDPPEFCRWRGPKTQDRVDWPAVGMLPIDTHWPPIKLDQKWKSALDELKQGVTEIGESLDLCIRRLEHPSEFV